LNIGPFDLSLNVRPLFLLRFDGSLEFLTNARANLCFEPLSGCGELALKARFELRMH